MRKLLLLILLLPLFAKAQNTVTLPTPTTAYTPQFRYYGAANDTLKSIYAFSGSVYNQIYTATQIAKLFRTPNSIFTRRMDSLFALSAKLTGNNIFTGNQTVNGDVTSTGTITGLNITATNNVSGNYGIFTTNLDVGNQISAVNLSLVAGANRTNFQYGNYAGGIDGIKIYTPAVSSDAIVINGSNIYGNNVRFLKEGDIPSNDSLITNAANGLTKVDSTVELGGDLTKNTTITALNKNFAVLGSAFADTVGVKLQLQTTNHSAPDPRYLLEVTNGQYERAAISGSSKQLDLLTVGDNLEAGLRIVGDSLEVTGRAMYKAAPVYTNPLQFAAIGDVVDSVSIANIYVPKTGNTTIAGNKTFTGETVFNTSTTLTDGTKNFKTQFGTVAGQGGQPFFQADSGYYVFKPLGTHAPRFYLLPTGTLTGTTSKFEMFNTDYIADQVNYSAFNIITNNATNTINIGANRNGSATRLQTIIGGDYNGSVLQAASPKITFNTDNSLSLSGNNMTNEAVVRNNFRINGNDVGGWNQFGLGIGSSGTSFANPLDIIIPNTGGTIARIKNPTAGTGNYSRFIWESDIINQFLITAQSSTFSSNGINRQSGVVLNSTGVGALNIGATNAAGTIGLYTGGSTAANERLNIDASGNTTIRVSTKTPLLTLTNLSAGTAGTDSLLTKNATTNAVRKIAADYYAATNNSALTGTPTAPTASATTLTTQIASTAFVGSMQNYTASGTGAATTITIAHGLTGITGTSKVIVQPLNAASSGISYCTIDATNVSVIYTIAPALGTNNLNYSIHIKP